MIVDSSHSVDQCLISITVDLQLLLSPLSWQKFLVIHMFLESLYHVLLCPHVACHLLCTKHSQYFSNAPLLPYKISEWWYLSWFYPKEHWKHCCPDCVGRNLFPLLIELDCQSTVLALSLAFNTEERWWAYRPSFLQRSSSLTTFYYYFILIGFCF